MDIFVDPYLAPLYADPMLRVALAAHLARYRGLSRLHTESDLRIYLRWCAERAVTPLTARRIDVELFVRWLQEVRRFKPSTVSRRCSRSWSASTAPASSTPSSSTHPPSTSAAR